jgi:hypothetical protein
MVRRNGFNNYISGHTDPDKLIAQHNDLYLRIEWFAIERGDVEHLPGMDDVVETRCARIPET